MRTGDSRRHLVLGLVVAAAAATAVLPFGTVITAAAPARAATTTETEAPDFASEVYHDPWDYSNAADQNTDDANSPSINVSGGKLNMVVQHSDFFSPVDTIGGFPSGRDGMAQPVDSKRYTMLSFSMTENVSGSRVGAVYWFTCAAKTVSCMGGTTFPLTAGTHTYDLNLANQSANTIGSKVPWSSANIVSFRVQPVVFADSDGTSTSVSFDWMRLHAAPTASTPHAAMPPGDYGTYAISALPEPVVDSPSPADGQDITAAEGRQPWDFTTSAGMSGVTADNLTINGYGSNGMTATNSGPNQNDPELWLPISQFDASTYHNLSFDLTYDGPFSLADSAGGGKMARLIWGTGSTSVPQVGNDMVTFSTANASTYSYDMSAGAALAPESYSPRVGWGGQQITFLRFDPNEDPGPNVWHLKDIHLRADPAAVGSTTVKFHDAAWVAGTTANVLVGTGAPGSAYTTIASGVSVNQGANSVQFALGSLPAGAYHVEVQLFHPGGVGAQSFSTDTISMKPDTSHDPKGSFDGATPTVTGATVSGWAFDPDASGATTVALYDQTSGAPKHLADVQTGIARADVQRAVSGAPANSGWSTSVTLGSGTHTVCAYAINQPSGNNPLLGCKSVTPTNQPPKGSFDGATGTLSGATLTGWAFDPDSSSPSQVAVYDQTGSPKLLGNVTTSVARADVQRSYPSAPAASGWTSSVQLSAGTHSLCVYAINTPAGDNPLLGCKNVVAGGSTPVGSLDGATGGTGTVTVTGWAFDADATGALQIAVYDQTAGNRFLGSTSTTLARPDVQRAVASAGPDSGFQATLADTAGSRTVCAYAINQPSGDNPLLGCKSVTVR